MLEKLFKLSDNKTSVKTEVIAGITTFITMAYILFLNPNILASTGMDKNAVFFATAISSGFVTIAMGLVANFPIALDPGMGLNALFATVALAGVGMPCRVALGAVFISGIIFIILTVTKIQQILVVTVPNSLKWAITVGIGRFITIIGLKLSEVIVVTTGILFLLALLIAPLAAMIPSAETAPALIIVGVLMASSVLDIDFNFNDITEGFQTFISFVLMLFTYSIANGIAGCILSILY